MKPNHKNDHRRKLASGSDVCCSVDQHRHNNSSSSSGALPGFIRSPPPQLPISTNMSNICSSTSAESSTLACTSSSPTGPSSSPSAPQLPIPHFSARNQLLKIKLPCPGDGDVLSLKFQRSSGSGADDGSHSDPLRHSICDNDPDQYEQAGYLNYGILSNKQQCPSIREKVGSDAVCSMCGDEGIAQLLFLCCKCLHRPQHIYCSRSYPDLCDEASVCNWCLHEANSSAVSAPNQSINGLLHSETNADSKAGEVKRGTDASDMRQIKKQDLNHEAHNLNVDEASLKDGCTDEISVSIDQGHGRAFEYLLMIAAESLPQVMGETQVEIKQDNHSTAGSIINISTNPKICSGQLKELDHRKLDMGTGGTTEVKLSTAANYMGALVINQHRNMINAKTRNGLNVGTLVGSGQQTVKMDIDDEMGARVGDCGHIPRRHRCSKAGITASSKCRKRGLQLSPSRPYYRRYKLLADVVC